MNKKAKLFLGLVFSFFGIFGAISAKAVCPVCTVAVGAGIGLSRWFGIDDTITGSWVGALLVSLSIWTINWIQRKEWNFRGYKVFVFATYFLLVVVPLFWMDIFWHPLNKLWGMDKLVLGMVSGVLFFSFSVWLNEFFKAKNQNKVYFPFQKVVLTVGSVIILSGIFYFLTQF